MNFSFIQITDHHLRESEELLTRGYSTAYAFRVVMRHIAQNWADRIDFIVTTGDLVDTGTDAEYQQFRRMLGITEASCAPGPQRVNIEGVREMPMYFLPGNHDPRAAFYRNMFSLEAPRELMNVTFARKEVQFVCLDWGGENKALAYPELLAHLARALDSNAPTIIWMHHAITPIGISRLDSFLPDDLGAFKDAIRKGNVLGILHGHFHETYESHLEGIPIFGTRATTFSFAPEGDRVLLVLRPPHYRVIHFQDGNLSTEVVEVPL
jgi:Icc protein